MSTHQPQPSLPVALDRLVNEFNLRRVIAQLDRRRTPAAAWWSLAQRRAAAQERQSRAESRAGFVAQLEDLGLLDTEARVVADSCIASAWETHRRRGEQSRRHPYLPDALDELDSAAPLVCFAARENQVPDAPVRMRGEVIFPKDLRGVREAITVEAVKAYVRGQVAYTQAVSSDPVILTRRFDAVDGSGQELVVQHQATGIRALFSVDADGWGHVLAKSHEIPSIDPAGGENSHEVDRWFGLGVGTRLYRRAAEEFPQVRWGRSLTQDPANGVRRKLHAEDPWRWSVVSCAWCREHLPKEDWRAASRADFDGHPGPEGAQ